MRYKDKNSDLWKILVLKNLVNLPRCVPVSYCQTGLPKFKKKHCSRKIISIGVLNFMLPHEFSRDNSVKYLGIFLVMVILFLCGEEDC